MARIPPTSVMLNPTATAVARRVCGALLFANHVMSAGAAQYAPEMEKNRDA